MPSASREGESLSSLIKRLVDEGIDLARAELNLARAEAVDASKQYVWGGVICVASLIIAIATVVIFAQATANGLQKYFNDPAISYLVTGLGMAILTVFLGWLGFYIVTRKFQPVSTIFKWLAGKE